MPKGPRQNLTPDPDMGGASTEAAPNKIVLHADQLYEGQLRYREIPRHRKVRYGRTSPRTSLTLPEDFIFENIPPELEIAAIVDGSEGSLRFFPTDIDFLAGVFSVPSLSEILLK